jgi:hypothetical protein
MTHGTTTAYNAHGCRCAPCKQAKAEQQRKVRQRRSQGLTRRPLIHEHVIEDALFMWETGESVVGICERLGIGRDGLDKHFRIAGIDTPWTKRASA